MQWYCFDSRNPGASTECTPYSGLSWLGRRHCCTGAPLQGLTQAAKLRLAGKLRAKIMAFVEAIEAGADRLPKPEGDEPQYESDDEVRSHACSSIAARQAIRCGRVGDSSR